MLNKPLGLFLGGGSLVPVNTVPPAVSGVTRVGHTLSTTTGTWTNTPTLYAYQWYQDDGIEPGPIADATASILVLASPQVGKLVYCVVTATNADGSTPAGSDEVGPVTDPPPAPENALTSKIGFGIGVRL